MTSPRSVNRNFCQSEDRSEATQSLLLQFLPSSQPLQPHSPNLGWREPSNLSIKEKKGKASGFARFNADDSVAFNDSFVTTNPSFKGLPSSKKHPSS
mmetsp:Transcript_26330/g.40189  ORF Transcript_26330/g.40189 Transcript_26330/m.40189 type:complete len:97 (-) Transcript_26330:498-788(-)